MRRGQNVCGVILLVGAAGCEMNRGGTGVAGAYRECERFADVPGTVVYFEAAGKMGIPGEREGSGGEYVMRPMPEAWKRVYSGASLQILEPGRGVVPPVDVVLYAHRRVSKEGDERLVVVGLLLSKKEPETSHLELEVYAFRLSGEGRVEQTWGEGIGRGSGRVFDSTPINTEDGDKDFVFYGGESDADPAKFVIPWSYGGQRVEMTGELKWVDDEVMPRMLRVVMHKMP